MKRNQAAVVAVGVGGVSIAFVARRLATRARLERMLEASPSVREAVTTGRVPWTPASKVEKELPILSFKSADRAFGEILVEVRAVVPLREEDVTNLSDEARDAFDQLSAKFWSMIHG